MLTAIPTPQFTDDFTGCALGGHLGVDTGLANWSSPSPGMLVEASDWGYRLPYPAAPDRTPALSGGVAWARVNGVWQPSQWVAAQCVVPLDDQPGTFPAVRVNSPSGDCYYLGNMGYTEGSGFWMWLGARVGGNNIELQWWPVFPAGSNDLWIDGLYYSDGFIAMLEVIGTNPVTLRASVVGARYYQGGPITCITHMPGDVPNGGSGNPAWQVLGTVTDSTYKIGQGNPGVVSTGTNAAGGLFNFNAGTLLSASASFPSAGVLRVSGSRDPGSTVTVVPR